VIASLPIIYIVKHNADLIRADKQAAEILQEPSRQETSLVEPGNGRPMLLDLGATTCVPCQMMTPILQKLRQEYQGRVVVQFVDVSERPDLARKFKIYLIPVQIFFAPDGKELYRHEGFFSREEILDKFAEFGWAK